MIMAFCTEFNVKYELANDGDDCVLIVEDEDLAVVEKHIKPWFRNMGFTMKVEPAVRKFEHIEFCQCHPVFTGEQYLMVRDPRVAIAKDCMSVKPLTNRSLSQKWASAVSQGGLSLTGGIPIWQDFYQALLKYSDGSKPLENDMSMETGFFFMTIGMSRRYSKISDATRVSFYHAFGITPQQQCVMEELYRSSVSSDKPNASLKNHYCF